MKLFYRELGEGIPFVILHGLYGSSDNWISIGRELSKTYKVLLVDQRNHGQSPHSSTHTYNDLVSDLIELFDNLKIDKAILLGHSMGGKAAMLFTSLYPQRVKSLIVVDILPFSYKDNEEFSHESEHRKIVSALQSIKPQLATTREELDSTLSQYINNIALRQFILKSIKRNEQGKFEWRLNVDVLSKNISKLMESVLTDQTQTIKVPTLFVKGQNSDYITPKGEALLHKVFSNFRVAEIPNAGHWLHAENPKDFMTKLVDFIEPFSILY